MKILKMGDVSITLGGRALEGFGRAPLRVERGVAATLTLTMSDVDAGALRELNAEISEAAVDAVRRINEWLEDMLLAAALAHLPASHVAHAWVSHRELVYRVVLHGEHVFAERRWRVVA